MTEYIIVITTCNDLKVKRKIINALLENRFSACIQVKKVESCYIWNDKIQEEDEYQLMIKTKESFFPEIERIIKSLHNYDVPQIISVPVVNGSSDYLKWVDDSLLTKLRNQL